MITGAYGVSGFWGGRGGYLALSNIDTAPSSSFDRQATAEKPALLITLLAISSDTSILPGLLDQRRRGSSPSTSQPGVISFPVLFPLLACCASFLLVFPSSQRDRTLIRSHRAAISRACRVPALRDAWLPGEKLSQNSTSRGPSWKGLRATRPPSCVAVVVEIIKVRSLPRERQP